MCSKIHQYLNQNDPLQPITRKGRAPTAQCLQVYDSYTSSGPLKYSQMFSLRNHEKLFFQNNFFLLSSLKTLYILNMRWKLQKTAELCPFPVSFSHTSYLTGEMRLNKPIQSNFPYNTW